MKNGILLLSPFFSPNIGGVETHLDDLCEYLSLNRIPVYAVTYIPLVTNVRARVFEKRRGIQIVRIPWFGSDLFHKLLKYPLLEFFYLIFPLSVVSFFVLLFRIRKIKVIHSHGIAASFTGDILAFIFNKRHITSIHAIYGLDKGSMKARVYKMVLENSDGVLTLSDASLKELLGLGMNRNKVSRFRYWVNQGVFKPAANKPDLKQRLGLECKFIVLFVGRFLEIKGIDILLSAAERLKNEEIYFLWVGDGALSVKIERSCKMNQKMRFIGSVNNYVLPDYYNSSDCLCVPSKYEEGYGRVILEALSCGLPVIASNRGGIPEVINNEVGILSAPEAESFKAAILRIYHDERLKKALSDNALSYSLEQFSVRNGEIILKAYAMS